MSSPQHKGFSDLEVDEVPCEGYDNEHVNTFDKFPNTWHLSSGIVLCNNQTTFMLKNKPKCGPFS